MKNMQSSNNANMQSDTVSKCELGVVKDFSTQEKLEILADAAKYADKYRRQTCLAQIQVCLEDGCSTSTNSASVLFV